MDVKEAIQRAKTYVGDVYADEGITHIGLEATEHDPATSRWTITISFARPWNTPRTRAQEVLEQLGAVSALKRSWKTVVLTDDGQVLAMRDPVVREPAE